MKAREPVTIFDELEQYLMEKNRAKAIETFTNVDEFEQYLKEAYKNDMQQYNDELKKYLMELHKNNMRQCNVSVDYTKYYRDGKICPSGNESDGFPILGMAVRDLKIYVPGKVIGVKIGNRCSSNEYYKEYKMVCQGGDHFDLRYGIAIGIAKYLYGKEMTVEGIEAKAKELLYLKWVNKLIDDVIKEYKNKLKEKEKEESRLAEIEEIKKRRREKNKKKAERRKRKQVLLRLSEDGLFTTPPVEIPQPDIPPVQVTCANGSTCNNGK